MPDLYTATAAHVAAGRATVADHQPTPGRVGPWCTHDGLTWPCPTRLAYLAGRADAGRPDAALTTRPDHA